MTTTDAPARHVRTGLQKTRDIALTVMAVMVSVVCALLLYFTAVAGSAIADLGRNTVPNTPVENFEPGPVPTGSGGVPCYGEEPAPPGC